MTKADRDRFESLAADYFDETLSYADRDELQALLQSDDRFVQRFAELSHLHRMLADEIAYRKQAKRFDLHKSPNDSDAARVMAALLVPYKDDLDEPVDFAVWREQQARRDAARERRARRNRLLFRAGIASGVAAVLCVAAVLIIALLDADSEPADIAQTPGTEVATPSPPARLTPVATLTDTNNAAWGNTPTERALIRGSQLRPGDRLTLTEGFAEITTLRGAVAILEAPATIELLDHSNAVRLHTGKLVGICESPSSKGFVVFTPVSDVVDLGTRFGVYVDSAGQMSAGVFDGRIRVQTSANQPTAFAPRELTNGQSLGVGTNGTLLVGTPPLADTFRAFGPRIAGITRMSGDVEWVNADPFIGVDHVGWPITPRAVLFEEIRNHTLQKKLGVDAQAAAPYQVTASLEPGIRIRSYVLLTKSEGNIPSRYEGQITFEGEILGVITGIPWIQAVEAFRAGGVTRLVDSSVINRVHIEPPSDEVEISPDRRTLRFNMQDIRGGDAVRVIVREPTLEQP
jgi:hypothetical protein